MLNLYIRNPKLGVALQTVLIAGCVLVGYFVMTVHLKEFQNWYYDKPWMYANRSHHFGPAFQGGFLSSFSRIFQPCVMYCIRFLVHMPMPMLGADWCLRSEDDISDPPPPPNHYDRRTRMAPMVSVGWLSCASARAVPVLCPCCECAVPALCLR